MAMTQPPSGKCSRPFTSHDTPQTVSYTLSHACDHHLAKAGNCRGRRMVMSTATIEQSAVNTYKKTLKVRERSNSIWLFSPQSGSEQHQNRENLQPTEQHGRRAHPGLEIAEHAVVAAGAHQPQAGACIVDAGDDGR